MENIQTPRLRIDADLLQGEQVEHSRRTIADIRTIFEDQQAAGQLPQQALAYEVDSFLPEAEGTPGGLYFGITRIHPGMVGDEYMMTKGHFHAQVDRSEFYWGICGEGILLLMDAQRNCRAERVTPGSLHYIPGGIAHRMINTGNAVFSFGACWPSDAGHDYQSIAHDGFSARVKRIDGQPTLCKA